MFDSSASWQKKKKKTWRKISTQSTYIRRRKHKSRFLVAALSASFIFLLNISKIYKLIT